jgi:hypothetical protein
MFSSQMVSPRYMKHKFYDNFYILDLVQMDNNRLGNLLIKYIIVSLITGAVGLIIQVIETLDAFTFL